MPSNLELAVEYVRVSAGEKLPGFTDPLVVVEDQFAEGGLVVTRHSVTGVHTGTFRGVPGTGKTGTITGITIADTTGGTVGQTWSCWDFIGLMQQLGVVPGPPDDGPDEDAAAIFRQRSETLPDTATAQQSKETVRRFYSEVWNRGHFDVVDELFVPDFLGHAPGGRLSRGPQAVKDFVADWRTVVPDVVLEIEDQVAEGSRCATRFAGRGTHLGSWAGIPPTGKEIVLSGISITRIVDGNFVLEWGEFDMISLLSQLGVLS
ncbi:hypothetical protein GCM10027589_37970 [Actinocorallia lasiicapitis]